MSNICARCRGPLEEKTAEEVAARHAERETIWGVPESACEVVCEDCWQTFVAADPELQRAEKQNTRHNRYT